MAKLYYAVHASAGEVAHGDVLARGVIDFTSGEAKSATVIDPSGGNRWRKVRLHSTTNCFVKWGEDPTAADNGSGEDPMGAENPEYRDIRADYKISVIERT